jgi:hypothetical protein
MSLNPLTTLGGYSAILQSTSIAPTAGKHCASTRPKISFSVRLERLPEISDPCAAARRYVGGKQP